MEETRSNFRSPQRGAAGKRFAHTLLFACPGCRLPVAVSRISNERNLETIDGETLSLGCTYCQATATLPVIEAVQHMVHDWPAPQV